MAEVRTDNHPYIKYADNLHEVVSPAFHATPITAFSISRIYNNGTAAGLITDKALAIELVEEKLYLVDVEGYQLNLNKENVIWSYDNIFSFNEQSQKFYNIIKKYNYTNGFTMIEQHDQYTDYYYFATNACENTIMSFLLNEKVKLEMILLYIKDKLHSDQILSTAIKPFYNLPWAKNNLHKLINELKQDKELINLDIKRYYLGSPFNHDIYFSRKEIMCLILFAKGRSARKIGELCHMSQRTVESHFDNIKTKTGTKKDVLLDMLNRCSAFAALLKESKALDVAPV